MHKNLKSLDEHKAAELVLASSTPPTHTIIGPATFAAKCKTLRARTPSTKTNAGCHRTSRGRICLNVVFRTGETFIAFLLDASRIRMLGPAEETTTALRQHDNNCAQVHAYFTSTPTSTRLRFTTTTMSSKKHHDNNYQGPPPGRRGARASRFALSSFQQQRQQLTFLW